MLHRDSCAAHGTGRDGCRVDATSTRLRSRLTHCMEELRRLNEKTEVEFLSIGSDLQTFHALGREISMTASSVGSYMTSQNVVDAISNLENIMKRIDIYIETSGSSTERRMKSLKDTLEALRNIENPLLDLKAISKKMRHLSLSTKIQSATIDHEGGSFTILADDINSLSSLIESKSADIMSNLNVLQDTIADTITKITDIQKKHRERLRDIMATTVSIVTSFKEKHQLSSTTAHTISTISTAISTSIGEIVESVQFHDITKQQIEHVLKAMQQVFDKSGEIARSPNIHTSADDSTDTMQHVKDIGLLQISQLNHSKEELVSAVNTIIMNLEAVMGNIRTMLDETQEITDQGDDDAQSFLSAMYHGLAPVTSTLSVLSENAEANRELERALKSAIDTESIMSAFVKDMDSIESEVEVLALNAGIKAAQIGEKGLGLAVIAQSIQKVSSDAHAPTNAFSEFIALINADAEELRAIIGTEIAEDKHSVDTIEQDLESVIHSLREKADRMSTEFSSLYEKGDILSRSIRHAIRKIDIHKKAVASINRVINGLQGIFDGEQTLLVQSRNGSSNDYEHLSNNYTMISERDIHRTYLTSEERGGDQSEMEQSRDVKKNDQDGFGNNVELF